MPEIAILIPCHNEELTIAKVVGDFRRVLPEAAIWVCDNASTDRSAALAVEAGAQLVSEPRRGKGYALRRLFATVMADAYVVVDGDDTYPAQRAHDLLGPVLRGDCDMVVGSRMLGPQVHPFRPGHRWGNQLVSQAINRIFDSNLSDVMSGYRALSRPLVRNLPLLSRGFEIETQLSIQALYYQFSYLEVPVETRARPPHSHSKLKTVPDGFKACLAVVNAFKAYRPLLFFGLLALFCAGGGYALEAGWFWALALVFLACGLTLDIANHRFRELGQLLIQRGDRDRV